MDNAIFKKGDLVFYKPPVVCIDDKTGELIKHKEFEGIGIIIDTSKQQNGWVRIYWQKYPFENLNTEYLTKYIRHYKLKE